MQLPIESGRGQPRFGAGRFPDPTVMNAGISSTDVENGDGSYEVKNVLWSLSGCYYEFAIVIKKSIYGLVVRANVLEAVSSDIFRRTGREVAIKVCAKDVLMKNSGVSLENPITEIGAMQDFGEPRHPNIATQFECCVDDKNIYSVLKFQPGVELFDHILNNGPLNEVAARCMFQQLMLAIFRLQWRDIGHRDISLENIMYNAADHATVLIDFGLCVKLQRDPENHAEYFKIPNAACGKSYYMPPESAWDERSLRLVNPMEGDIWSAGMCLLYALLGFPPIERACEDDVRYRYLTQGRLPELLDHWEASLSPELVDLLQLILQAEPSDRPSVQQILQHSWMQRDGPPCPYQNEILPQELAAALGFASTGAATVPVGTLAPLQRPPYESTFTTNHSADAYHNNNNNNNNGDMDCSLDSIDEDDATMPGDVAAAGGNNHQASSTRHMISSSMSVNTADDCAARESDLLSYRSSVESRWSCGTTPTSSYSAVPARDTSHTNNNSQTNNNSSSFDAYNSSNHNFHTHNTHHSNETSNNNTSKSIPSSSSSRQHYAQQEHEHPIHAQHPYSMSSASMGGLDSTGSTSGVDSGDSTPSTHHPSYSQGPYAFNSSTSTVMDNGLHDDDHHSHNHSHTQSTAMNANSNASTTVTNSTNKSSRNNHNATGGSTNNTNFTGYHTRSQSFGKANINYAV